jgi:predicted nucleic acid-binding protein
LAAPGIVEADPDDDKFLLCAMAAGAEYLISSDSHLLDIEAYSGIKILAVRKFMEQIAAQL